jgi:hypothetical protein
MKKQYLLFLVSLLLFNNGFGAHTLDSGFRKHGIHLMISANSIVLGLNRNNPANFFYSGILIEPQYNFQKHTFGLGLNRSHKVKTYKVNELPCTEKSLKLCLMPTYSYLAAYSKHWQIYTGLGFVYNYKDTFTTTESDIEVITHKSSMIEKGLSIFGRIHYRFNRYISLGLELPVLVTISRNRTDRDYPLTPSMSSSDRGPKVYQGMFFIPSNIFIRLSI